MNIERIRSKLDDIDQTQLTELIRSHITGEEVHDVLVMPIEWKIACLWLAINRKVQSDFRRALRTIIVYAIPPSEYIKRAVNLKLSLIEAPPWSMENFDYGLFCDRLQFEEVVYEMTVDGRTWTIIPDRKRFSDIIEGELPNQIDK